MTVFSVYVFIKMIHCKPVKVKQISNKGRFNANHSVYSVSKTSRWTLFTCNVFINRSYIRELPLSFGMEY